MHLTEVSGVAELCSTLPQQRPGSCKYDLT